MKVAFIGLGTMGAPMARRLQEDGYEVAGWDVTESGRQRFTPCAVSLMEAVSGVDVVITMLPNGSDVASVYKDQVLSRLDGEAVLIDCSTIDVETTRMLSKLTESAGFQMLDAPVSGGAEAAATGSLSFMVGGREGTLSKARPLLETMGSNIMYFGGAGSGQAAKACHNMICGITALGVCEAFALADALGLDSGKFFNLCRGAAAQSWILENRCPVPGPVPEAPSSNNYAPGFAARLMAKDLGLAQQAAKASGQETPFGTEASRRFFEFADGNKGDLDFSAIYETIRSC